ncbi:hypothetical protein ASPWEDRAFT_111704 [Aspergillus wentii DTO 134E9]|uniref:Cyclin-domain-containing protein n=1 Tax=Aspergillus wentii DTO 134E9 TaxID=1073089 RepID=A0A1L9RL77_ASPWE|nr:uncharacterized protein ASPWEDRAFT_111704 [Aspergillus wentii DTO 134E9]OJJ35672.1 hypothetical protein ASPWEDRAFT_111704 [Aspergillus wentii DTO 134E9]
MRLCTLSSEAAQGFAASASSVPPPSSHQQYEPAGHSTTAPKFSPHSSRLAIEELRSALTRHTVEPSSPGPSGDLPRGRFSAGLTTHGGGNSSNSTAVVATNSSRPSEIPASTSTNPPARSSPPPMPAPSNTGSNKRNSQDDHIPDVKRLPENYEEADSRDIVVLISSMLMELIRFNDKIPLHQGRLTRFHSRSPPRISVHDYLQRLTTHATLSPPILLSMVYYIDRLCALYPAFTVSSLTIHRFLIASATVASKGLSDSFWTNKTYARVGGISLNELALLELEFLFRVEWRIVPQPEVLVDYYQSLVERCDGFEIQRGE